MTNIRLSLVLFALSSALRLTTASAADIAIVDFADQWTRSDALRQTLDEFGVEYDDLTADLMNGDLPLADQRLFFIGSMTTNNPTLHLGLDQNAEVIQDFAEDGGVVIEPTQADQNEARVDWLPPGLSCVRTDPDSPLFSIVDTEHPLFNEPHEMRDADFQNWGYLRWPTVWEVIGRQTGFEILAESRARVTRAVIMEAEFGDGKFVMMALAPDKYHIVGNDENTRTMAGRFMENILETYLSTEGTPKRLFRRGDVDGSGALELADPIGNLTFQFLGTPPPVCLDTLDWDDNGLIELTDPIGNLGHQFLGQPDSPPPGSVRCGVDPTVDGLGCPESQGACQ